MAVAASLVTVGVGGTVSAKLGHERKMKIAALTWLSGCPPPVCSTEGCPLSHSPLNKTTMSFTGAPLPYCQRPEWQDITPLPQHESLSPLAPIFYTDECMARSPHIGVSN
jgi:hypothetical protein